MSCAQCYWREELFSVGMKVLEMLEPLHNFSTACADNHGHTSLRSVTVLETSPSVSSILSKGGLSFPYMKVKSF